MDSPGNQWQKASLAFLKTTYMTKAQVTMASRALLILQLSMDFNKPLRYVREHGTEEKNQRIRNTSKSFRHSGLEVRKSISSYWKLKRNLGTRLKPNEMNITSVCGSWLAYSEALEDRWSCACASRRLTSDRKVRKPSRRLRYCSATYSSVCYHQRASRGLLTAHTNSKAGIRHKMRTPMRIPRLNRSHFYSVPH